ncbi:MAG: hypothetical protein ACK5T0_06290 [Vampirovibrionales bacterium]
MKPSSFSSQISLYSQVQKAKTASAFSPDSVMSEEEGITKTSASEKLGKQLSPTKTIGALGGGLIGLTGLYMLGQKARDFLFGEASSPSPPSVPPTPVASEVLEVVPTPEKNLVQQATEWGKNTGKQATKTVTNVWETAVKTVQEVPKAFNDVLQNVTGSSEQWTKRLNDFIQLGMENVKYGMETTQENANVAMVHVTKPIKDQVDKGMNRQVRFFNWFEEHFLKPSGIALSGNENPHAISNTYTPEIEVIPPDAPPKPKTALGQGVDTVDVEFEEVPKKAGEVVEPHPVTRMRNRIQDGIDAGSKRERDFLDRLAGLWEKIGYNPLEGKWKPKAIKASTDEVIDVVAREIPKKADRATQLAHFVSAFMASSVDIGKENTPELIKKLQKTVPKKVARFKMFKGFKIFKP